MHFSAILPSEPLRTVVERYWVMEDILVPGQKVELPGSAGVHHGIIFECELPHHIKLPNGKVIQLPQFFITGHLTKRHENSIVNDSLSPYPYFVFGTDFKHTAFYHLFHISANTLNDTYISMDLMLGQEGRFLKVQLTEAKDTLQRVTIIESFLLSVFRKSDYTKKYAEYAVDFITSHNGNINIDQLSKELGISSRHLNRIFTERVGICPKLYARILRFNYVSKCIQNHPDYNWHDIIHEFGYYDQSHFIKEFIEFSGTSPSIYFNNHQDFNKLYF